MNTELVAYILIIGVVSAYFYVASSKLKNETIRFDKANPLPVGCKVIYALAVLTIVTNMLFSKSGGLTVVLWGYLIWHFHKRNIVEAVKVAKFNFYFIVGLIGVAIIATLFVNDSSYPITIGGLAMLGVIFGTFLHSIYTYLLKLKEVAISDATTAIFTSKKEANESHYAEAFSELSSDMRRDGLWAVALANNNGDENKAKAEYIKKRVLELSTSQSTSEYVQPLVKAKSEEISFIQKNTALFFFVLPTAALIAIYIAVFDKNLLDSTKKTFTPIECTECSDEGCKGTNILRSIEIDSVSKTFKINFTGTNGELQSVTKGEKDNCAFPTNDKFTFGCLTNSSSNVAGYFFTSSNNLSFDGKYFTNESHSTTNNSPAKLVFRQQCRMQ
ncbi:hypothetical protein MCEMAEM4_00680 [Burkholderiaceae bacterium]